MAFELETYKRAVQPVKIDDIDFDGFRERPLSAQALRSLHYMADVETHTVCYLRDLLVTPSHQNPRITTFLTMWNYEEYWHGEVIDRILGVHGEDHGPGRARTVRRTQGIANVVSPITQCLTAAAIGEDFIATHMSWGAINEWSTHAAYARLIERENHPVLTTVLRRIMRQETRHVAFYTSEARARLARSARARRFTRWALRTRWRPVGSTVMPRSETTFLLGYLFGDENGRGVVGDLDHKIDRLPGLGGLGLVSRAVGRFGPRPGDLPDAA
ncbi:hypothetical protein SAMN05421678_11350 [Actinopolymorpha cephalotaxi]|uniref:Ferritin-like domain-containing protein n=1 Tax=Actinopolymorpha cephalotaxi TaxID=504797 RepID=A0A1I2XSW1_9ACTN|nr:hypothetical protein [Actinopolymorpha cephalotaxi]NYH87170.1 hypothetical protein [Actinopolymorpha cephalotaxi]SFH16563.1 hypothetical protein SAMN05421678_11350 [Actinopolymorpha cephalotaxi]